MAKTPGFTEYVDDRDPSISDVLQEGMKRASEWFEDRRIDSNGVVRTYTFSKDNHRAFVALMEKHDKEFGAWMGEGGEDDEEVKK